MGLPIHRHAGLSILAVLALLPAAATGAAVVINEVMYHAPSDVRVNMDELEYVELHNASPEPVDIAGWRLAGGIQYTFPPGTRIDAGGYLVICRSLERFKAVYGNAATPAGTFKGTLKNSGEKITLRDAAGKSVDSIEYVDEVPWPVSADGSGASLERICPDQPGNSVANWAPSAFSLTQKKAGGTPGQKNASHAANLPPVIADLRISPSMPAPDEPITVQATVRDADGVQRVRLFYRVIAPVKQGPEVELAMEAVAGAAGTYRAVIPGQADRRLVRLRIEATDKAGSVRLEPAAHDLRPMHSVFVLGPTEKGPVPAAYIVQGDASAAGRGLARLLFGSGSSLNSGLLPRGSAAFVLVSPDRSQRRVFDFVNVTPRKAGYKVHFHRDQPLVLAGAGDSGPVSMDTINLIFEAIPRMVLAEPLAYELYRRAGVPAPRTAHLRIWMGDELLGYHLLVEQPNRSFLRNNGRNNEGNLYKMLWYEHGLVRQHEKKTNTWDGHDDLVKLAEQLTQARGDEQWKVIQEQFNVEEMVNYYVVSMCISNWDGFFNNYFIYHDTTGTGKWEMYPWDEDKTFGTHDGMSADQIFFDMPLTFGMAGDLPPGSRPGQRQTGFGFYAGSWWRPPGYFSGPLLANPQFRQRFLARLKEVNETIHTERAFFPAIDEMEKLLLEEVRVRAASRGQNGDAAVASLKRDFQTIRQHITKRREFIAAQPEVKQLAEAGSRTRR